MSLMVVFHGLEGEPVPSVAPLAPLGVFDLRGSSTVRPTRPLHQSYPLRPPISTVVVFRLAGNVRNQTAHEGLFLDLRRRITRVDDESVDLYVPRPWIAVHTAGQSPIGVQ